MIIFTGFPNDKIMNEDVKIDFEIEIYQDINKIYSEKLDTKMDGKEISKIIFGIKTIIDENKNQEFALENLIEFLIWFDKRNDFDSPIIKEMIQECAKLTDVPNLLKIIIDFPEDIKNYNLTHLVDDFMKLDFHLYNDNTFILLLQQICEVYERNYKDDVINIMKRYVNEKTLQKIKDKYDQLGNEDIINIINGHLTKENIQSELDHLNFLMELAILNEEK